MARYKVTINTDSYICMRCSKKNWEPGTMNDYMLAINGWHTTESNLKEVMWRLEMFAGNDFVQSEWSEDNQNEYHLSDTYTKWRNKKCNWVNFFDRLCGIERMHRPCAYGFAQGYFDKDEVILELRKNGIVRIPFAWLYDIRQYYKGMDGCYMEIVKY